ncbi:MAG: hypothetical protein U1E52_09030 [Geminicoccaceae bacterium]
MVTELSIAAAAGTRIPALFQGEPRPPAAAAPAPERQTAPAVEASQALDQASRAAARALFWGRDVEITSFQDQGTGRVVYRVADRASGQVLHQSPPEALLRFFASARQSLERPLVAVET